MSLAIRAVSRYIMRKEVTMPSTVALEPIATWPGAEDMICPDQIAQALRTTKAELAETVGLPTHALGRKDRIGATKTQMRLRELWEILTRMSERQGGFLGAYAWLRSYPLEGFGHVTPAQLLREGRAGWIHNHLDRFFAGGYA